MFTATQKSQKKRAALPFAGALGLSLCLGLFAGRAFGDDGGPGGHPHGPFHACRADAERLCKNTQPGGGRIIQCLEQHESELSAECKQERDAEKAHHQAFKAACGADAQRLCQASPPAEGAGPRAGHDHGQILMCLHDHQADLSPPCKSIFDACTADAQRLCKEVQGQAGQGRILHCLHTHEADLSPTCKQVI